MNKYQAFARSCVGASHLRKDLVCQDSSLCAEREKYSFAAVADGHGSPCYLRTERGSRFAVECALGCADEFMESLDEAVEILDNGKDRERLFNQLWRSIVSRWHERVEADFAAEPFTEEELSRIPEKQAHYRDRYESGRFMDAYGTTLVFTVMAENFAFCIQIGDGSCSAFFPDGSIISPVPDDPGCHDNVTTSLCQDNAVLSARSCYFSGDSMPAAVFLGTDGVENSYATESELHGFYIGLARTVSENGLDEGLRQLEEFLPVMTKKGSGDDVSCAGIIELCQLNSGLNQLLHENENGQNPTA